MHPLFRAIVTAIVVIIVVAIIVQALVLPPIVLGAAVALCAIGVLITFLQGPNRVP